MTVNLEVVGRCRVLGAWHLVVFGDRYVFPASRCTPEALCEAGPATSCYPLLDFRSAALVISPSHHVLQVQACLEPKGYLLFLLKECWLFNLSCRASLSLLVFCFLYCYRPT